MGGRVMLPLLLCLSAAGPPLLVQGGDPYLFFTWNVTYSSISPLGTPQQGILINNQFPRPNINSTTNNNIVINVFNYLDEPFLLRWNGIQHRKNSWQDDVLGTNCPIPPKTNYTYRFQVKDQIGSYMYYPVTAMHKVAGGFGGLRINSRLLIPVPYDDPSDDYTILAGDWFSKGHIALNKILDSDDGKDEPLFSMELGKTYKYRICNVGIKTALNIQFQGHNMRLVEMEGSHTMQSMYDSLDVHVGQCYSVLVMANREPMDYYVVASTRFTRQMVTATPIIRYPNEKGVASPKLPPPPTSWAWSLNQFRTFRWNLTASAARLNPQGSYHYGSINITRTIKLINAAVSYVEPSTPLKLAEYYNVADKGFKYDNIVDDPPAEISKIILDPIIIFENHENAIQSWHLSGYSFFAVAPEKRKNYNILDAVSRHTIQVFPQSWAAILLTFDNCGMWNIRSEIWDRHYLGQQLYVSVLSSARSLKDEYNMPDDSPLCGIVESMPKPQPSNV
ncbi:hypothetical protein ES319_A08G089600v1 [Gossypium barbadense]|uniref:Plastocyanin-like domain-containing protein n=2 Tax=Gossypium TaxID=3633 RepID=A0A5J5UPA8_GOSBA|nr:hypothetical protein ES319_A08G089600v1 [Gossypium barbadense]TYH05624.1 hypothetical protein ES288_A08G097100v1 [Gossypium darwinii]